MHKNLAVSFSFMLSFIMGELVDFVGESNEPKWLEFLGKVIVNLLILFVLVAALVSIVWVIYVYVQ